MNQMQSARVTLGIVGNTAVYSGPELYAFLGAYRFYTFQVIAGPNGLAAPRYSDHAARGLFGRAQLGQPIRHRRTQRRRALPGRAVLARTQHR